MYTSSYHVQHEAGHFLVAYLLGVLPKGYTITSLDTLSKQGSLNIQAGTAFVDYEFLEEVSSINYNNNNNNIAFFPKQVGIG